MAKSVGFKFSALKIVCLKLILLGLIFLPDVTPAEKNNVQNNVKTTAENFFKELESYSRIQLEQEKEKIGDPEAVNFFHNYFDDSLGNGLFHDSNISSWNISDITLEIDETRDFKMVNMQNEIFAKYIRLGTDSRYYSILLSNLASLPKKLRDKSGLQNIALNTDVSFQNSCFVHKDSLNKYREIELQLHKFYQDIFETVFLKNRTQESVKAVFSSLSNSYQLVDFLHHYEVDEKIIEQQSRVSLAYSFYNFYKKNDKKMAVLLGKDYRELQGSGLWNFKVYKVKCDVVINTCPQCRGLKSIKQQWELHIVKIESDEIKSGLQVWNVNKIVNKK